MNILTFDIEEWSLYARHPEFSFKDIPRLDSYLDKLLGLLEEKNIHATFFCLGSIARGYPEVIKKIHSKGHHIGCHSDNHVFLRCQDRKQIAEDTKRAVNSISDLTGEKTDAYRAPAFSITPRNSWVLEILLKEGITIDSSIFPASRSFGGFPGFKESKPCMIEINGITIKEFPITTANILYKNLAFSGGGYFRFLPYPLIFYLFKEKEFVISYFHIRDFDKEQQRYISLRYFKNYYGINSAYDKFKQLTQDFKFLNIREADAALNWSQVAFVNLKG